MWWVVAVMVCSVPIVAIITDHMSSRAKIKGEFIRDQLELEKVKQQNYLLETEKLKLELQQMHLDYSKKEDEYKVK